MKVSIGINGATPVAPDYTMLKAALVAAQAATPTGRAGGPRDAPADPHAALHAIFTDKTGSTGNTAINSSAAALGHRFNIDAPDPEDRT